MKSHQRKSFGALRVAYVTTYDPTNRQHWSGSGHAIMNSLIKQNIDVFPLGPLQTRYEWLGRLKGVFYKQLLQLCYEFEREAIPAHGYASQVQAKLKGGDYDVILSPGAIPVSRLRSRQPIVIWADATFASYISHYRLDVTLSSETIRAGHRSERAAFDRCALLMFASDWAAQSAIADYGVNPSKVKVVPFGANFLDPPTREIALSSVNLRSLDRCRLITIGVDWFRKGVPRSIELATMLNHRGLRTTLDVVGCGTPAGVSVPEFVNVTGFIDKRTTEGERALTDLLLRSHFHVLFSSAEAFGVVFAEANAHAVPNIANDVGGIGTSVVNELGGRRFDPATPLGAVADYITTYMKNPSRYSILAQSARKEYEERLNWHVSGALAKRHLEDLISA